MIPCFAVIALVVLLWLGMWLLGLLHGLEQEALRWSYKIRGELQSNAPILFVDLDAPSVAKIGDKPWDRLNFAQTVNALMGVGQARAMGIDIIFSPMGTGSLLDVDRAREGDLRFGQIIERYQDRVVLAAAYTGTTSGEQILPLRREGFVAADEVPFPESPTFPIIQYDFGRLGLANVDETLNKGVVPHKVLTVIDTEGSDFSRLLINGQLNYFSGILNEPRIVHENGTFKLVDADGFPTQAIPDRSRHRLFTLGMEVFLAAHGLGAEDVEWTEDALIIRKHGEVLRRVPLIGGQTMELNWFEGWQPSDETAHFSMATVLDQAHALAEAHKSGETNRVAELEAWFAQFKDKVIFLGPVDATLKDLAPTPFSRSPVPKVGMHANIYRTLQEEAYIRHADTASCVLIMIVLPIAVAALALWSGRGRRLTRTASVLLLFAYAGLVFAAFGRLNFVLPLISPLAASVSAAMFGVLFKLGAEEWQRHRIKTLFGAYVSPELVDQMVNSQQDPELGGTEAEVTALFSDVEGFSSLSELLTPTELITLMNEYLSAMTDAQQAEGGTLDKYIGDAIVTMFGMPLPIPDHAARACQSAIRMQERHAELRRQWADSGQWPDPIANMRTRIGLNSGHAVIGNMGSRVRFNYTMMGDSVNLAARCESGAKSYGVYTMITESTLNAALETLPDLFYRRLDRIIVKGRSQPVEVIELWDGTIDANEARACREHYEAGLQRYYAGAWADAISHFKQALPFEPCRDYAPTTPSKVLLARCEQFLADGGPADWNGAYRMQTK